MRTRILRLAAFTAIAVLLTLFAVERWTAAPTNGHDGRGFHDCVARLDQIQPGMSKIEAMKLAEQAELDSAPYWAGRAAQASQAPTGALPQDFETFCGRFEERCPYGMSALQGVRCSLTMWRYGANHIRYELTIVGEQVEAVHRLTCYQGSDTIDCPQE